MLRLSSTSALVLLWAQQECYQSEMAKGYLGQLNLEEGRGLYERCRDICPYYDEVIKNRKFGIVHLLRESLDENVARPQVVIAGAGFDALGIEIVERYPEVRVFELDRENMGVKAGLSASAGFVSGDRLTFIEADLLDTVAVEQALRDRGWDFERPTVLVLEGVSYYLSPEALEALVRVLKPGRIVLEFLKEDRDVAAARVDIPKRVFGLISEVCGLPEIHPYSYGHFKRLFPGRAVLAEYSMQRLELMRTGENRWFPSHDSGWIEVCLLGSS